jgi:SAM-dependent methyltransferase
MAEADQVNREQAALWNDTAGRAWVEMQRVLDDMFTPFEKLLLEHAAHDDTRGVLDIGCGAGVTTLAAARRIGPSGKCVGLDISATLLDLARQRATREGLMNVTFVEADAQTHAFEPNSVDAVISRFGVMFFDSPEAAFTNIKRAARPNAKLAFVAWRSPAENPFMTTAARAAAPLLPSMKPPDPSAPGQFSFADADKVQGILQTSGWKSIEIQSIDVPMHIAEDDLFVYVTKLGPVGMALKDADTPTREKVTAAVQAAFQPFIEDGAARFNAACWLVTARS